MKSQLRIALTAEQCHELEDLQSDVMNSIRTHRKRGMIIAQVFPDEGIMKCGFIPAEIAYRLQDIMWEEDADEGKRKIQAG